MDPDKQEELGSSDDHATNPDTENQQDDENDQAQNKHKDDAKQTSLTPTQTAKDEDILEVDMSDEDDNSIGSTTEAMLDTDSLADSQNEDKASETRKPRRCKQRSPGSYAQMHKGNQARKGKITKKSLEKTKLTHLSQKKIILQLEEENKELRKKLENEPTESRTEEETGTEQENKQKIQELEAEIDHLIKQIEENDTQENRQQQQATTKIKEELEQANELAEDLQIEIDNLKQKIQDLETANRELVNINQDTKQKLKEANKKAKNMEKTVQQTTTEKRALEQVAQMKSTEIAELKGDITRLQNQLSVMTRDHQPAHSQPQTTTILLGDSNCRDIHPHLMRWLNQSITKEWAPTLNEVKSWIAANKDNLAGKRVILMIGTNDLKNRRTRQEVSAAHKEATDEIREAGAQLTVVQLPPVYHPQARAETRARDTEIINEILLERHGATTAKADKVTIHRGQIKSDGIHLTNESAEIMAEQITEAIEKSNDSNAEENIQITIPNNNYNDPETQDNNTTKEVTTTVQVAGKIIGRGGERIRKLKTLYRVEINTDETDEDHRTFQITGPANNATKVQKIIKDIAREITDRDQEQQEMAAYTNAPPPRQQKSTELCRFFQKGKCNRGSSCYFLHQSGPADISMETEISATSEEEEPSPVRKITIKPKRDTQHTSTKDRPEETKERQKRKPRSPQRKRKQPNHRTTSDDGTPERKATKKRQPSPSPSDRTTTTKKKTRTHNTPSPHTSRNHNRRDSTPRRQDHHNTRRDHSTRRDHHSPRSDHSTRRDHHSPRRDHSNRRDHHSPRRDHHSPRTDHSTRRDHHSPRRDHSTKRDHHSPRRDHHSPRRDHHSPRRDHSSRSDHHSPRRSHYSPRRSQYSPSREHQGRNPTPSPRRPDYSRTRTRTPSRDNDRRRPKSPEPYRERQGRKRSKTPRRDDRNQSRPGSRQRDRHDTRRQSPPTRRADRRDDRRRHSPATREDRSRTRSPPGEPRSHQRQHRSHDDRELAEAIALFLSRRGTR